MRAQSARRRNSARGRPQGSNAYGSGSGFTVCELRSSRARTERLVFGAIRELTAPRDAPLSGLGSLQRIHRGLEISSNASLVSLHGLEELRWVTDGLYVTDNLSLPTCEAWWLRDRLTTFGSTAVISGNLSDVCE
jgi:hypothetical protein